VAVKKTSVVLFPGRRVVGKQVLVRGRIREVLGRWRVWFLVAWRRVSEVVEAFRLRAWIRVLV
jgi:hypothetical protein